MSKKTRIYKQADVYRTPVPDDGKKLTQTKVSGCTGLYVNTFNTDARSYHIKFRYRGVSYNATVGSVDDISLKDAIDKVAEARRRVKAGGVTAEQFKSFFKPVIVSDLYRNGYKPHCEATKKSHKNIDNIFQKRILPALGDVAIADISRASFRSFLSRTGQEIDEKSGKKVGPETLNRLKSTFSGFCRYAMELDLIDVNPCAGIRALKEGPSRSRFFVGDEYTRYGKAALELIDNLGAKIILLAMLIGLRPGELKGLLFTDFFQNEKMIFLRDTKNGDDRFVPIGETAVKILAELANNRGKSPWVFPAKSESGHVEELRYIHAKICKKAGLTSFQIRDLRRSHATMLRQTGSVDLLTIKEILGHRSLSSTLIYTRVPSSDMIAANNLADQKFLQEVVNA